MSLSSSLSFQTVHISFYTVQRHEASGPHTQMNRPQPQWTLGFRPNLNMLLPFSCRCQDAAVGNSVDDDWLANWQRPPTICQKQSVLGRDAESAAVLPPAFRFNTDWFSLQLETSGPHDPPRLCSLLSQFVQSVPQLHENTLPPQPTSARGSRIFHRAGGASQRCLPVVPPSAAQGGE